MNNKMRSSIVIFALILSTILNAYLSTQLRDETRRNADANKELLRLYQKEKEMLASQTLLSKLEQLAFEFNKAWEESNDQTTGAITASLMGILGAIHGGHVDLLTKFSKELGEAGLARARK